jgi:apolipoprotein N-acyltransferase
VAWIPLLYVWKNRENQKDVFLFGWNAFLWWNLISTYWVCNTALVAGIVAIGLNSLLMSTVFWIASLLSTKVRSGYHFLLFASSWISFEYVHYFWDIQWPWLTLGNSLASFPPLAQWYAVTGVFGGSLWILALNWLGWTWICRITEGGRSGLKRLIPVFLLFLLPIGISLLMLNSKIGSSIPEVEVAVIQPNYEPHYEKFTVSEREVVDRVLSLSEEIVTSPS